MGDKCKALVPVCYGKWLPGRQTRRGGL